MFPVPVLPTSTAAAAGACLLSPVEYRKPETGRGRDEKRAGASHSLSQSVTRSESVVFTLDSLHLLPAEPAGFFDLNKIESLEQRGNIQFQCFRKRKETKELRTLSIFPTKHEEENGRELVYLSNHL